VPALRAALKEDDPDVRFQAAVALAKADPRHAEAAAAVIVRAVGGRKASHYTAAPILRELGAAVAVPPLGQALDQPDLGVRGAVAAALCRTGLPALPALTGALAGKQAALRRGAALALGKMGPGAQAAVPALGAALKDPDKDVRLQAARALGYVGPGAAGAVPALKAALRGLDRDVRLEAAQPIPA